MKLEETLQKIYDRTADLADLKKELKEFEKDTDDVKELKKMAKELRAQIKEKKENQEKEWLKDQYYKDLREDIVKIKGDLAEYKTKAINDITKLSAKGEHVDLELKSGADTFRAQSKVEPFLFINGRKVA